MLVTIQYHFGGIVLLPVWRYNFIRGIGIANLRPDDGTGYDRIRDFRAYRLEK